jgi:chromosome partition protein MukB
LLGDAFLLGPPDYVERSSELGLALAQAVEADDELRRTQSSLQVLAGLHDALRAEPPTGTEVERREARHGEAARERIRLFGAIEALELLSEMRPALELADSDTAISERSALMPSLEAQLARARANLTRAEQALGEAEAEWETATLAAQVATATREAAVAERTRVIAELQSLGVRGASESECEAAHVAVVERERDRESIEREERKLATHVALTTERRARAGSHVAAARATLAADESAALPAAERWVHTKARAEEAGMLALIGAAASADSGLDATAVALEGDVRSRTEVLIERLVGARGGEECAQALRAVTRESSRAPSDGAVDGWSQVMAWLEERLPAQVADGTEPLVALDRLRSDLGLLEERLARQERELRGASEDVARGIDVQLRRAAHQVQRLNRRLDGLAFGAVAGIRVELRRIERMQQVLLALRDGAVQELLFDPSMPIEQALAEIFKRYGAGRTGGSARILDYREYIELAVEIRRRTNGPWEPAHPTRLSTGEAIGVGAALMMVVLTEWEHDASLLRSRRIDGSLCLLFLDEANRLSQDNLGVLFELCRNLDLQLLIAAPEVARAEGNTTYRLVRSVSNDGQDEVLVTGRRIR